ncbi:hypothetical protein SEUCBS140593_002997 [Sporothrix eucalyptigena]|uniref:Uncharacterized protein n=1 Tax=Sporothrix eucalyptigena TaxID=1812306 RepID=A0ABP0BC99_9PEZI
MKLSLLSEAFFFTALAIPVEGQAPASPPPPVTPGLDFLFSCNVSMGLSLKVGTGIKDTTRAVFPIHGGQAIGPKLSAKVLEVGADWASYGTLLNGVNVADDAVASANPNATTFFATDARFQLLTLDGANILVETKGQTAPPESDPKATGAVHVQAKFGTTSKSYSWLNDILSVGILRTNSDGYQIDLWQLMTV